MRQRRDSDPLRYQETQGSDFIDYQGMQYSDWTESPEPQYSNYPYYQGDYYSEDIYDQRPQNVVAGEGPEPQMPADTSRRKPQNADFTAGPQVSRLSEEKREKKSRRREQPGKRQLPMEPPTQSLKQFVLSVWKHKRMLFVVTALFMVVCSGLFYYQQSQTETVLLSLNYEESSKGLNPNSTRFDMYEIQSEEVLQRAIRMAGLEGELSTDALGNNITVSTANVRSNLGDTSYYISTDYKITYKLNKEAARVGIDGMLSMICKAYNDVFHERYVDKKTALQYQLDEVDDVEYLEIGNRFDLKAAQLDRFLTLRIKKNASYTSSETGDSFQTLQKLLQDLQVYSIDKYKSFVLESGLAKSRDAYINEISFSNSLMNVTYRKDMARYNVKTNGINMYDEAMIGIVMIPSINDKNEYYMSKTNIGMDYLAKEAKENLISAQNMQKDIEENNNVIAKLAAGTPGKDSYQKAEQMIVSIDEELKKIAASALSLDDEYIKYTTKDYLQFKNLGVSYSQQLGLRYVVLLGMGFGLLLSFRYYRKDRKQYSAEGAI